MQFRLKPTVRSLQAVSIAFLAAIAIMVPLLLNIQPVMAMVNGPTLSSPLLSAMTNKMDAAAKDAEGKLESAYGELTGDTGHQIKGKAKQVQASAMNATEDLKQGAQSVGKKLADATGQK
jgi:uncharacterized protein YjbJ (UPF0337 family)